MARMQGTARGPRRPISSAHHDEADVLVGLLKIIQCHVHRLAPRAARAKVVDELRSGQVRRRERCLQVRDTVDDEVAWRAHGHGPPAVSAAQPSARRPARHDLPGAVSPTRRGGQSGRRAPVALSFSLLDFFALPTPAQHGYLRGMVARRARRGAQPLLAAATAQPTRSTRRR